MRRLLASIAFALLLPCVAHAAGRLHQTYDPQAQRYFDQQVTNGCGAGTDAWKASVNALVVGMKADGNWPTPSTGFDGVYVPVAPDTCTMRINLVNPTRMNLTISGTCTFVAYQSIAGNGTDCQLSTGVNWSVMTRYLQDSAHLDIWKQANGGGSAAYTWGYSTALNIRFEVGIATGSNTVERINTSTSVGGTGASAANMFLAADRTDSTHTNVYKNGAVLLAAQAGTSSARPASPALIFNSNGGFSSAVLSEFAFGSQMDAAHEASWYARLRTFMLANGVSGVQ